MTAEANHKTQPAAYNSWASMIQRCTNPRHAQYGKYSQIGGICARWRSSFASFFADMGPRPAGMSLDRIDNENCCRAAGCAQQREEWQVSDPKPSAAELVEVFLRMGKAGHYTTALLEDIVFAARAEAVAPVLAVLRELVAAMPMCTAGACGDAACEGCDVMCGRTATRGIVCDEHGEGEPDSDYAAPLRAALALLAETGAVKP